VQQSTLDYLHECYEKQTPITDSIHQTMSNLFKYYIVVGGMPDVVRKFIDTHDIGQVSAVQRDIIAQYRQDISKYAATGKNMINNIFDNIPSQLDDKNRRFMLSSIQKSARLRDYEDSFVWLSDAGVALPCYNLTEPKIPLKINEKSRLFKLYMSDVGLLCAMSLENVQFEILKGNLSINMGGILENTFAELLKANGFSLRYLNKKNIGELDFVVQQNDEVMPIEIKSGKDYQTHDALNNALKVKDWNLKKGLVFCMDNIRKTEKITYLPWYLVMFLKQNNSDESMIVNVDLSGL
jgi:predicted AAA+ superfamily ATPase